MKSIAIVTDGKNKLELFLKQNLEVIFKGFVEIKTYYLKNLKESQIIDDDVVLVMTKDRAVRVNPYVRDKKKIVVINRTLSEKNLYKIFSIPEGMDVLVVNDNYETTLQMVSLLYELGINHLSLIPYDFQNEFCDIKIAITPREEDSVPKYIEKIIDVGHRNIDISTFLRIINILELKNKEITRRVVKYSDELITIESGVKSKYKELFIKNQELDTMINLSNDGILRVSDEGIVKVANKCFCDIFEIQNGIIGCFIKDIFKDNLEVLIKKESIENEVYKFKNKYLNINKRKLFYFDKFIGSYFNIQEITYIKQLEQNLSKKLREKGQVARYTLEDIKTQSSKMITCKKLAEKIAKTDLTVLVTGESGTGKELIAQSIHNASDRKSQPFIAINCAAMPENLLESELFGYEKGAFTGALKEGKRGLFEQAHNGTIFLDEIGDMPIHLQTKLLRVLQERQVMRIGSEKVMDIDVRVISATNKDLLDMIERGRFREDLYYRLNVLPIKIPSLKERKEDIILLAKNFMNKNLELSSEVQNILVEYQWQGNIRELINAVSYIETMCENEFVSLSDLPFYLIEPKNNYEDEIIFLKNKKCFNNAIKILQIINSYNKNNKSIGRNNIEKVLASENIFLTEGEIRKILNILNQLKLVQSYSGRKGSVLTEYGSGFFRYLEQ